MYSHDYSQLAAGDGCASERAKDLQNVDRPLRTTVIEANESILDISGAFIYIRTTCILWKVFVQRYLMKMKRGRHE
jgi:hypothetical protein